VQEVALVAVAHVQPVLGHVLQLAGHHDRRLRRAHAQVLAGMRGAEDDGILAGFDGFAVLSLDAAAAAPGDLDLERLDVRVAFVRQRP